MHKSSYEKMRKFVELYLKEYSDLKLDILDVGSQAISASNTYKPLFNNQSWNYVGLDMVEGNNVDVCVSNPYDWNEVETNSFDIVISGQVFEHIQFPWSTIFEIGRVLKDGGLACIIAPSSGPEHKFPFDCWRYYPDGFSALCQYIEFHEVEVFTDWGLTAWQDSFLVIQKPKFSHEKRTIFMKKNLAQKLILDGDFSKISNFSNFNFNPQIHQSIIGEQENKDAAFAVYQEAIKSEPKNPIFYQRLRKVQMDRGDMEGAITTSQVGIKVLPKNVGIYFNLGSDQLKKGDLEGAIASYQKAIELNLKQLKPNQRLVVYKNLGDALQKKGRVDEAISAYEKALQLNPNFVPALSQLTGIYESQKQFNQAVTYCQRLVQLRPNNKEAQNRLVNLVRQQEKKIEELATGVL